MSLYSSLKIGLKKWPRVRRIHLDRNEQALLFQTLQAPRFTFIVTEFKVDFSWCSTYNTSLPYKMINSRCTCDEMDRLLGAALISLENLITLHYHCICCYDPHDKRHIYLQNLKTTPLKHLQLHCRCTPSTSPKLIQILSAPCMRSAKDLSWTTQGNSSVDASAITLLEDKDCFPKLKYLLFGMNEREVAPLIRKSSLVSLSCDVLTESVQEILEASPSTLKYLRVKEERHTLPSLLTRDFEVYRSLKDIGMIYTSLREVRGNLSLMMKVYGSLDRSCRLLSRTVGMLEKPRGNRSH